MKSIKKNAVDDQREIPLYRQPKPVSMPIETIALQTELLGAITLAVQASGVTADDVCSALEIDPGHYSKIMSGKAHFPTNKLDDLMDYLKNEIPLEWQAHKRGYELKPLLSTTERQLQESEEAKQGLQQENELLRGLIQGKNRLIEARN